MKETFFLLAGGLGTRARPLTLMKPKPAFPLNGLPLIELMLQHLKALGFGQGFVNLHHLPEIIDNCLQRFNSTTPDLSIHHVFEETLSGSKVLREALPFLAPDDLLLAVNGDIFLEIPYSDMKKKLLQRNADVVLLVRPKQGESDRSYRPLLVEGSRFKGRGKIPVAGDNIVRGECMYPGVALFTKKAIEAIQDISFFDSLERENFCIETLAYDGIWLDIGDPEAYKNADRAYRQWNGVSPEEGNSLSPGVEISPDSTVRDCIVWENTKITGGSVLRNCIVSSNLHLSGIKLEDELVLK